MTDEVTSAFLKTDTPANACTVTDRALREAFRASMDVPEEKAGLFDQLNARIASLKPSPKAKTKETAEAVPEKEPVAQKAAPAAETPKKAADPQDPEGTLFAHLNEILEEKVEIVEAENAATEDAPKPKSIIGRIFSRSKPVKAAKPAEAPTKKPSGSIILRALSALKPAKKAKVDKPAKEPSGSVVVAILKAISPIKAKKSA